MLKTLSNATTKFVSEVEIFQPLIRRASARCLLSKEGFLQLWAFLSYLFNFYSLYDSLLRLELS